MILLVEAETVDRPHWGWKNPKARFGTAVRDLGQWPNGWTGNLEERLFFLNEKIDYRIKFCMHIDNDNMYIGLD
jgi:hypothetical protein